MVTENSKGDEAGEGEGEPVDAKEQSAGDDTAQESSEPQQEEEGKLVWCALIRIVVSVTFVGVYSFKSRHMC